MGEGAPTTGGLAWGLSVGAYCAVQGRRPKPVCFTDLSSEVFCFHHYPLPNQILLGSLFLELTGFLEKTGTFAFYTRVKGNYIEQTTCPLGGLSRAPSPEFNLSLNLSHFFGKGPMQTGVAPSCRAVVKMIDHPQWTLLINEATKHEILNGFCRIWKQHERKGRRRLFDAFQFLITTSCLSDYERQKYQDFYLKTKNFFLLVFAW